MVPQDGRGEHSQVTALVARNAAALVDWLERSWSMVADTLRE